MGEAAEDSGVAERADGGKIGFMQNPNLKFDSSRRQFFLKLAVGGLVSGLAVFGRGLFGRGLLPESLAAGEPMLDEKDPLATALGYSADATKVDAKKFPKIKESAGQNCSGCQFYTAAGKPVGPCSIFPGKNVNSKGWCNSWIKRAG